MTKEERGPAPSWAPDLGHMTSASWLRQQVWDLTKCNIEVIEIRAHLRDKEGICMREHIRVQRILSPVRARSPRAKHRRSFSF